MGSRLRAKLCEGLGRTRPLASDGGKGQVAPPEAERSICGQEFDLMAMCRCIPTSPQAVKALR